MLAGLAALGFFTLGVTPLADTCLRIGGIAATGIEHIASLAAHAPGNPWEPGTTLPATLTSIAIILTLSTLIWWAETHRYRTITNRRYLRTASTPITTTTNPRKEQPPKKQRSYDGYSAEPLQPQTTERQVKNVAGQRTPQRGRGYSRRGGPTLDTAWRTVTLAPAIMLYGPEDYFASRATTRLRKLFHETHPEVDRVHLNAATYTAGELTLQTSPSLFGSAKIIEVENVATMSEDFLIDALAYLKAPEPDIMLILHHTGGNRGKKLIDLVRSSFTLVNCKALKTDREKSEFLAGEFATARRPIAPGALALLTATASDTAELAAACQQLLADIPGDITEEAVNRYYVGRTEVTAFRVSDAAISGNTPEALRLLRHALATGTEPIPMLGALAMRIRNIARVYRVRMSANELAREVGMAPWQVEQAQRDGRRFTQAQLAHIVQLLADADAQLKGESQDAVYAVERAVLAIAQPARD